jgi:hypothetical protein
MRRGMRWAAVVVTAAVLTGAAPADDEIPLVPLPTPPVPGLAAAKAEATKGLEARDLHRVAVERYAAMDSYVARLSRREVVRGKMGGEEIILFKFRKEPWSVYLKWLGTEGKGREVLFVKGRFDDKIQTILAKGDAPFTSAGQRMALDPQGIMVRAACRHPVTEAGIGASLERIARVLAADGDPKQGTLTVLGPTKRAEFEKPARALEHTLPEGLDPSLPRGGKRTYVFDPEGGLPLVIFAADDRGREMEYYRFDRVQASVRLDDQDFDPEQLWGKAGAKR